MSLLLLWPRMLLASITVRLFIGHTTAGLYVRTDGRTALVLCPLGTRLGLVCGILGRGADLMYPFGRVPTRSAVSVDTLRTLACWACGMERRTRFHSSLVGSSHLHLQTRLSVMCRLADERGSLDIRLFGPRSSDIEKG